MNNSVLERRLTKLGFASLPEYMSSPLWQAAVAKFLADRCYCCGKKQILHVYHCTFTRLGGNERQGDLVTVCHWCKRKINALVKHQQATLYSAHKVLKKQLGYTGEQTRFGTGKPVVVPYLEQSLTSLGFPSWQAYRDSDLFETVQERVFEDWRHRCHFCVNFPTGVYFLNHHPDTLRGVERQGIIPVCEHHLRRLVGGKGNRSLVQQRRTFGFLMRDLNRQRSKTRRKRV